MEKNSIIRLEITQITHEGMGLGRFDGMAVFVPSSALGELLSVRIVKVRSRFCYGRIEQIIRPSPDRAEPECPTGKRCGGCVFRHVKYEAQLRYKQELVRQNLERIGSVKVDLEPIIPSPSPLRYRNKAQYPVRLVDGAARTGFFAPRSHSLIVCGDCLLQPQGFAVITQAVLDYMADSGVSAYDETSGKGLVRHLYIREGASSGERMVCVVVNGESLPDERALVERLSGCGENVVSILLNVNTKSTNVILGDRQRVLYGPPTISDTLCGLRLTISAHSFYQVNSRAAELLFAQAAQYAALDGSQTLLDMYCGAGVIGLSMAKRCKRLIGVEVVPQAIEDAKAAALANGITNARFICADAAMAAKQLAAEGVRPDVVIVDPPRKGCDETTLRTLAQMRPERIVYISCDSATLARDCAILDGLGYAVMRARPADMFAYTAHVETVVLLSHKNS